MYSIYIELGNKWVKVAEIQAKSWQDAVRIYREDYSDFLSYISFGHTEEINIEAEQIDKSKNRSVNIVRLCPKCKEGNVFTLHNMDDIDELSASWLLCTRCGKRSMMIDWLEVNNIKY